MDTCLTRVMNATDTCSSVRNVGELHRDLRDWNTKVKATGSFLVLRCKYKGYILINVLSILGMRVQG